MPHTGRVMIEPVSLHRSTYPAAVIVIIAIALVVAWLFLPALTRPPATSGGGSLLEGALRADAPEFEKHSERIVIARPAAIVSERAPGDVVVELKTNIRNETGRRISGLEMHGAVVDAQGTSVGERTAVIIPEQQTALEPGEEMSVRMLIEGISPDAERADVRMEVTGLRLD